jgi:spermidine/putrescine transport system ATP-binding protein
MNDSIAIEFREVVKRFGTVTAVDRVSFHIQVGEFFSLLGPSGCGKTTSLRLIAGFENPDEGQILIDNQPQNELPPHRRAVNTVFQNYALFPHLTVYQNVAFGLEMDRIPEAEKRRRVHAMLELVRLPGMENRRPGQLSGGQQQRVALARALVKNPKVLLLDEPLGALDLKLRKAMQVELKLLQHQVGITFVYVTHDQEEALTMSDRIAVMNDGHVLQIGAPREIYENPHSRFVADFIGETNLIPAHVEQAGETWSVALENGQQFFAQAGAGLEPGDRALVSIRPEKIQLARPGETGGSGSENPTDDTHTCLTGQIVQAVYLGTDTRYLVELPGDIHIIARLQNLNGVEARFLPGDPVQVIWDAHHARILKE